MFKLKIINKPKMIKMKCNIEFPDVVLANLQEKETTPTKETQVVVADIPYDGLSKVTVNPIPDEYIIPSGEIEITANGNYDVRDKENAIVNVPEKVLGTKTITANGTYNATDDNLDGYSEVKVEIGKYAPRYISFYQYQGTELDYELSNLDTSNMTSMSAMFFNCQYLNVNITNFDTSKVTNMSNMFSSCYSSKYIYLQNFNTSKVTNMSNMFLYCENLKNLDISCFDTSNVTNMSSMFRNCSSLTSLDLSSFNTSNVTSMYEMFQNCSRLTNLNISNFDFTKVTSYNGMFNNVPNDCYILVKDATAKEWITSKYTSLTNVHYVGE